ncbi:MAG TPA: phytoene/squalene synthase family protein [Gammaproteobacteria bacterium]|nr:phytoene/squalene synthase family protein [Gammaproteobacteria bacterium]
MKSESSRINGASPTDLAYQESILPGVSRTFALTIPVLPEKLAEVVTNAYLLCRLADTIEDDVGLDNQQKSDFHQRFVAVVNGGEAAEPFAAALLPLLSSRVLPAEKDLVQNAAAVIRVTHSFSSAERAALTRCVSVMCSGMPEFQRHKSLQGLEDLQALGAYCYFVAGVVGEMCTELFCLHSPEMGKRREELMRLAVSFGQGLQMTNILKDIWDDRQTQACWLPRSVFGGGTFELERLEELHLSDAFREGLNELIGIAHAHLRNALEYTCMIPKREVGIRKFCLWAIGLAVLTLRKIHRNPAFRSGSEAKVSRRSVKATVFATNLTLMSNRALRMVFARAADGLPLARLTPAAVRTDIAPRRRRLDGG